MNLKLGAAVFIFIFLSGAVAAVEDVTPARMDIYEIIKEKQNGFNEYVEQYGLPSVLSRFASSKINMYVGRDVVGIVLVDGKITEVIDGRIEKPTLEFKTSVGFFYSILKSKNPVKRINYGLKHGFIVKREYGFGGKAKSRFMERVLEQLDKPEPKIQKKVEERIEKIAAKKGEDVFEINPQKLGLEKTGVELKGKGFEDKKIWVEEYTGYTDVPPPGIKEMELDSNEGILGTYVRIEAPGVKADEVIIKIKYTDEELEYKFLDENSLRLKWYDEKTNSWKSINAGSPEWVKEIGINKEENYIYAKLKHFSVYGISGTIITPAKIEEQRNYEPAYFVSREEVDKIRAMPKTRGIIDRIIDFVLGFFIK